MVTDQLNNVYYRARRIKLLLTDADGVLTDGGVYYSAHGEELKRFSIRDGRGMERLRRIAEIDVGIITGEQSDAVTRWAEKLRINEFHPGIKEKTAVLQTLLDRRGLLPEEVAYIGDDINDTPIMQLVGLAACPADATSPARAAAHYHCSARGGHGAFREFAEFIIEVQCTETNLPPLQPVYAVAGEME